MSTQKKRIHNPSFLYGMGIIVFAALIFLLFDNLVLDGAFTTQNKKVQDLTISLEETTEDLAEKEVMNKALRTQVIDLKIALQKLRAKEQEEVDDYKKIIASEAKVNLEQSDELSKLEAENQKLEATIGVLESKFKGYFLKRLSGQPEFSIKDNRFIFKSDVFFKDASNTLSKRGKNILEEIAHELKKIIPGIPKNIAWIIRINGHTNHLPIHTQKYPSNWYLSAARAIAVTEYLIRHGVPADRLVPTALASYEPLVPEDHPDALEKNRYIDIQFAHR